MDQMSTFSHGCFVIVAMQNVIYDFKEAHHMVGIIKGVLSILPYFMPRKLSLSSPEALARHQGQALGRLLPGLTSGFLVDSSDGWEH